MKDKGCADICHAYSGFAVPLLLLERFQLRTVVFPFDANIVTTPYEIPVTVSLSCSATNHIVPWSPRVGGH